MHVQKPEVWLQAPQDAGFARMAKAIGRLDAGYSADKIPDFQEGETERQLDPSISNDVTAGAISFLRRFYDACQEVEIPYKPLPGDIEYTEGQILIKDAEQGNLVVDLLDRFGDRIDMGYGPEIPALDRFRHARRQKHPEALPKEANEPLSEILMLAASGQLDAEDSDYEGMTYDGQQFGQKLAQKLLNEDLYGLGSSSGYPNESDHRQWQYDRFMNTLQHASHDMFELARQAGLLDYVRPVDRLSRIDD